MVQFFSYIMGCVLLSVTIPAFADSGHQHHAVPTLNNQTTTKVTFENNSVTLTFGPIDLPPPGKVGAGKEKRKTIFLDQYHQRL